MASLPVHSSPILPDKTHGEEQILMLAFRWSLGLGDAGGNLPQWNAERLLELSDFHGLVPFVLDFLRSKEVLPDKIAAQSQPGWQRKWQNRADLYLSHHYWRRAQWHDVRALLEDREVAFAPLKGAALWEFFEKPYRQLSDFDVWIRPEDFLKLHRDLEKAGFRPHYPASRFAWHHRLDLTNLRRGAVCRAPWGRYTYVSQDVTLDVHWLVRYCVQGHEYDFALPAELKEAPGKTGTFERALPIEQQLLIVLVHALASHRLFHWMDVFVLWRRLDNGGFDARDYLLTTPAMRATPQARQYLLERLQIAYDHVHAASSPPAGLELTPLLPTEPHPGTATSSHWPEWDAYITDIKEKLRFLTPTERAKYLVGYCFPSRTTLNGGPFLAQCGRFYCRWVVSFVRMIRRLIHRRHSSHKNG